MQVKLAKVSGFCGEEGKFGVSGAIRLAQEAALSEPGKVYLVGELVHNEHVTQWLKKFYGIKIVDNLDKIPAKSIVVVKAHGAAPDFWALAESKGIRIVDATCPMVQASQQLVRQIIASGKEIIYIASDKNHDEALSVSGQVSSGIKVVTLEQLPDLKIKKPDQTVVLTQTTLSILETEIQFKNLQKKYPALTIRPHLCQATTQRQKAVLDLANEVDFLLIIGAPHSSNSQRLLEVAQSTGKPSQAINDLSEIKKSWLKQPTIMNVGIIAGASTPNWIVEEVINYIRNL